ncbi:PQQ-dependent methanol/ethanol family dehydrogenase [Bradyrhizobium sp. ISRA443]|uniref:PQQ-dependent methanol/ethanol family dehydrogenase n=1 Tax=unclassified Bradyrhizobium TaxID=2631580 RepID=UPI00247895C1|nr:MULTISPECIES: PQQ-dependent methanol/ethanol family dehydrogenase [unclassified Bradyrhizobium]WGR94907.1 PQQ-dependent methanol/ethanol family dehydrogenase [Bradyrhizobium sp. ISRA435]WGR99770.1 PQQ-dependent methanol/ethanol family dehydrogenase [Bradyrhizobium sp. ISRA436]WGS06660.1 PQQ-dependent methanol/ethanol family dehydrogenase [Bradyrhizobium sp. ISRA437]WGS13544.1 PQQ-dependent methanol/ethanol family dehydrogenase [Bradyrhizobium sp. ISRA443]
MKLRSGTFFAGVSLAAMLMASVGVSRANDSVVKAASDPNGWAVAGHDYGNTRFSPLKQINSENVGKLQLAYSMSLASLRSNESSPIVIGKTLYVSTSWGPKYVYAIDAATGARKWTYQPDIPDDVLQYACCDVNNRGVSYANGKIFVGRLDGKLTALDAETGKELWTSTVVDYKQGSVITSPPLVVRDKVITGFGGGEYGVRGALQAFDLNTGKLLWQTYTVPAPGEPGSETWKGDTGLHGGGAAWLVGSYDAKSDTVYWGTSNPGPWNTGVRSTGDGNFGKLTNLYTASTLAIDPNTGKIKWHIQGTPADAWDYDGVNELVLANLKIKGAETPVLMKADRNGFFFVANRETGKVISAEKYVFANWAKKWDVNTMRAEEDPDKRPGPGHPAKDICPNLIGGKNWQPMSFNPQTGLVYIPTNNVCMDWSVSDVNYKRGVFYLGAEFPTKAGPGGFLGELVAWDPIANKKVWGLKEDLPFNGGTLTTAGNLVFSGNLHGDFRAIDAKNGKVLWSKNLGSGIGAGPVTYSVDGKQYVAIVVGRTASIPAFLGDIGKKMTAAAPEGGSLFVFSVQ